MPNYQYKAIDDLGRISTGQMDAVNEIDLEVRLERTGLTLINFRAADRQYHFFNRPKISIKDLMDQCGGHLEVDLFKCWLSFISGTVFLLTRSHSLRGNLILKQVIFLRK